MELLNKYNSIDINAVDQHGKTALMYACENCNEEIIRELIHKGAKIDIKDKNGLTAIEILKIRYRYSFSNAYKEIYSEQNTLQENNNFDEKQIKFLTEDFLETRKEILNRLTQLGADVNFAYKLLKKPELRNRVIFHRYNKRSFLV